MTALADLRAERVVIGGSLRTPAEHTRHRDLVAAEHFHWPEHRRLFAACHHLADLGPFLYDIDTVAALRHTVLNDQRWRTWLPPGAINARCAAASTIADVAPMWAVRALTTWAQPDSTQACRRVRDLADQRAEAHALRSRLNDLEGA